MTIKLGYSRASRPSALRIAEASDGQIIAVQGEGDVNWGRRFSTGLNATTENCVNKRRMRELFAENGVPMPTLVSIEWLSAHLGQLSPTDDASGIVWIGRPDFHTRGRGFWRVEDADGLRRALRGTRRKLAATHFMEFVAAPKEFRVHVFQGKSVRISLKAFNEDKSDYVTAKPDEDLPRRHLRRAAVAAVAALGLDFGAVDILASEDQAEVYVLEVNAAPGLGGSMPRVWAQTFIRWGEER
jgi:glutathione synthase/RimK-type ligase-like ATP-grasp enzyme